MKISAKNKSFTELNREIRNLCARCDQIEVTEVEGHRYLAAGLEAGKIIQISGTPGNDLGCYMDGARVEVFGNGQDAVGNTMNGGSIIIHGHAGDALGYAMRGGELYVRDNAGYRCGIHMKEYGEMRPVIVIGGTAGAFLGEYMAGGVLIVLGLNANEGQPPAASYCATGMHGGVIYLRGRMPEGSLSPNVRSEECGEEDAGLLRAYIEKYCSLFGHEPIEVRAQDFLKIRPASARPYGNLYVHN